MINRREILQNIFALKSFFLFYSFYSEASNKKKSIFKIIPSSKEKIPSIGMGTWITFDVGYNTKKIKERSLVLNSFFDAGGSFIDTSPMYGSSETVLGKCFKILNKNNKDIFAATKIWTPNKWHGRKQFENSKELLGESAIKLLQVHNLLNYKDHIKYLNNLKESNNVKYVGITTSHGRRHEELLNIMRNSNLDFIQITYNVKDTECEYKILPLAQERGIAVIANRPFQGGRLFNLVKNLQLPNFVKDLDINSWAELFLKFTTSHPAITCAIPATSKKEHMDQNMTALFGNLLSNKHRLKIKRLFSSI